MKNEKMLNSDNIYVIPEGKTVYDLARNIKCFLANTENMEAQVLKLENESYFVQARSRCGKLKQFVGLDKMISIKLTPVGDRNIIVEIGKGKWVDKVAGGVLVYLGVWPLIVTTAYGAYKQGSLPRKVINNIESFLV